MNIPTDQKSSLAGKRVIILGGSSGIGLATALAAASEGAAVHIVSGNRQRIDEALQQLPGDAKGDAVDLNDETAIRAFFEQAGAFDHLVYSAGENISLNLLAATDIAQARQFFNVRYWGALAAVKYAAPFIRPGGSINFTSGIASLRPGSGWAIASSICGAIEGLTRAMAVELAPVRVNCVMPGVIKTNLWNSLENAAREDLYRSAGEAYLVKRVGEPADIAGTHIYLMKQSFTTGQCLVTDGGAVLV